MKKIMGWCLAGITLGRKSSLVSVGHFYGDCDSTKILVGGIPKKHNLK